MVRRSARRGPRPSGAAPPLPRGPRGVAARARARTGRQPDQHRPAIGSAAGSRRGDRGDGLAAIPRHARDPAAVAQRACRCRPPGASRRRSCTSGPARRDARPTGGSPPRSKPATTRCCTGREKRPSAPDTPPNFAPVGQEARQENREALTSKFSACSATTRTASSRRTRAPLRAARREPPPARTASPTACCTHANNRSPRTHAVGRGDLVASAAPTSSGRRARVTQSAATPASSGGPSTSTSSSTPSSASAADISRARGREAPRRAAVRRGRARVRRTARAGTRRVRRRLDTRRG